MQWPPSPDYEKRLRALQMARRVFDALFEECHRLVNLSKMYDGLFIDHRRPGQLTYRGPSKRHLLAKSGVSFWNLASKCMYLQWHLQSSRLADPARTMGRDNLSVHQMNERLAACDRLTAPIKKLAAAIDDYAKHTRPVRHRLGAHNDLDTHLDEPELGAHSDAVMAQFFRDLNGYTDHVGRALGRFRGKLGYVQTGNADDLLRVLEAGLSALKAKRETRRK